MTRKFLMTSTTIATLIAAPMAFAAENSASDLQGNSPAVTEGGNKNVVGSTANSDIATKRVGLGIAEYDATRMVTTKEEYQALARSVGADFKTQDNEVLGVVDGVTFDAQGNPELVVNLNDDSKIDADTLVVTLLPESLTLRDGKIFLDTTADELYLKAQDGSKRDDETRTTVIVM
ncbi:hypothetical protein OS190_07870 [Sulfitobacter sp. F26204]|uniref:hypothetical protein n=1 Tax=Sulfitobacter sp. F26204 TaxID=2996014 RepID=UPI00225E368D|nr:hypothetical protein [Sulfitobacter sp. F26204]MCX7559486.1 hypothetical protein [Sulfitobacter sp. F26204]